MNILIIDDIKADRELAITHIKKYDSIEETNISESDCLTDALKKISLHDYDVIILDLHLPESNGIKTIETLSKHLEKNNKKTPIIVFTATEEYSVGIEALSTNSIKDFITKDNKTLNKELIRALTFVTKSSIVPV